MNTNFVIRHSLAYLNECNDKEKMEFGLVGLFIWKVLSHEQIVFLAWAVG